MLIKNIHLAISFNALFSLIVNVIMFPLAFIIIPQSIVHPETIIPALFLVLWLTWLSSFFSLIPLFGFMIQAFFNWYIIYPIVDALTGFHNVVVLQTLSLSWLIAGAIVSLSLIWEYRKGRNIGI